jgi:hypothetical protein
MVSIRDVKRWIPASRIIARMMREMRIKRTFIAILVLFSLLFPSASAAVRKHGRPARSHTVSRVSRGKRAHAKHRAARRHAKRTRASLMR